jgi:hypothetical protein
MAGLCHGDQTSALIRYEIVSRPCRERPQHRQVPQRPDRLFTRGPWRCGLLQTVRAIHQELPHLTAAELEEFCRVNAEELRLDAAVYYGEAEASQFIADTLIEMGQPNLKSAFKELTLRSEQGDQDAAEAASPVPSS